MDIHVVIGNIKDHVLYHGLYINYTHHHGLWQQPTSQRSTCLVVVTQTTHINIVSGYSIGHGHQHELWR